MAQLSLIGDAFLDGFGSLGAVFEPVVRPGSRENLILEPTPSVSRDRAAATLRAILLDREAPRLSPGTIFGLTLELLLHSFGWRHHHSKEDKALHEV